MRVDGITLFQDVIAPVIDYFSIAPLSLKGFHHGISQYRWRRKVTGGGVRVKQLHRIQHLPLHIGFGGVDAGIKKYILAGATLHGGCLGHHCHSHRCRTIAAGGQGRNGQGAEAAGPQCQFPQGVTLCRGVAVDDAGAAGFLRAGNINNLKVTVKYTEVRLNTVVIERTVIEADPQGQQVGI